MLSPCVFMTSVMTFHNAHNIHYKRVMTIRPKIFMQNERNVSLCDYYSTLFSPMNTLHSNAFFHLKDDIGYTHGPKYSGSLIRKNNKIRLGMQNYKESIGSAILNNSDI